MKNKYIGYLALVPFAVVVILYELLPLLQLVYSSLIGKESETFGLENFIKIFTTPLYQQAIINSVKISLISAIVGIIVASVGGQLEFTLTGEGFLLLSAAANASSSLLARRFTQEIPPMTLTGWGLTLGGALLLAVGLAGGGYLPQVSGRALLILCYLFLLSATAFSIWTSLLKYNDAGKVCIFNSLSPIFGTFLSILLLGEDSFQLRYLVSLALVCGGVYLVNRTAQKRG